MEFTGDYYRCEECLHIWDYMDICPNCGEDTAQETLNANKVREWQNTATDYEAERLEEMLNAHDD
jgi:predicted RNA-binding Zn-ribbon protein involved in translation (DUF1610 family)